MSKSAVEVGDRFVSVDAPTIVWVASQVMERAGEPSRRVVVVHERQRHREKTLSEAVLLDPKYHRRLDPA